MSKVHLIDPEFYETHSFADDIAEAKANGDLIITRPGEGVIEAIKRHKQEKENRLAVGSAKS